jgi:acylphosphatase
MGRQRLHIYYSGRVQGIGFRYSVMMLVRGYEVTGWIRNLPDGRVEMVAEGERAELEAFAAAIRESELAAYIRQEDRRWGAATQEFHGFEIRH